MDNRILSVFLFLFGGFLMNCSSSGRNALQEENKQIWTIPGGGNAYITADGSSENKISRNGITGWQSPETQISFFFKIREAGKISISLELKVPEGESVLEMKVADHAFTTQVKGEEMHEAFFGNVAIEFAGYLRVDLKGLTKTGDAFAVVKSLVVSSSEAGQALVYVKDNEANRYYWGRRGPSVHMTYKVPDGVDVRYFYNELTVPEGEDPIGSYFMANGFGQGYFGIQVNSLHERRILFSVWSPFSTDDPSKIPEDERIVLLEKGDGVHAGEFGNEGSGGQSYLVYPWKAGETYRFLNAVEPDGNGNTIYTAWFYAPGEGDWRLVASFLRPKTNTHLTRPHSFLENFIDSNGYKGRRLLMGDQWIYTTTGEWLPLESGVFTCDDIGRRNYREDYAGGVQGNMFFLQNGGFFDRKVEPGTKFERTSNTQQPPEIDFSELRAR